MPLTKKNKNIMILKLEKLNIFFYKKSTLLYQNSF